MNSIPIKLENTLDALEQAITEFKPEYLRPYLNLTNVLVETNKDGFYTFFRYMLRITKKITEGELHLNIIPFEGSEKSWYYEFFDEKHLHPRITVIVEQYDGNIHLNVLPF